MNLVDFALFSSRRKYIEELVCLKLLANHPALNSRRQWGEGTSIFVASSFGPEKKWARFRTQNSRQRGTVFLHCMRWDIGSTPSIYRMSVLEAPLSLIWIEYDWESASTIGEAEKWSNCRIGGNLMHE